MSKETPKTDRDSGPTRVQINKRMSHGRAIPRKSRGPATISRTLRNGRNPTRIRGRKMAVNKPVGDNARKGAVKKRSQVKTKRVDQT
jgi:hypothetical protein